ncbi:unnamed protein product [Rotaria magnacalcarata]|uniref:Uncharacterized protein n=1 Tax=Rotaria magnacalcarata TaxID=392030 RepID=A0A819EJU4_9BILA|nr:unnamed protein product [Rotaria magnacalcarata]
MGNKKAKPAATELTQQQISQWYQGFIRDSPNGRLDKIIIFQEVYAKFYPQGDVKCDRQQFVSCNKCKALLLDSSLNSTNNLRTHATSRLKIDKSNVLFQKIDDIPTSNWDDIAKSPSSHDINVNLGAVKSVPEAITTPTTSSKALIIVVATCVAAFLVASVTIVVALTLAYTGPLATILSATTTTTTTTTATQIVAAGFECLSYTTINDSTRLTTATGGTTAAPAPNHCGTQGTGWYTGSLPASGISTSGTVCYAWDSNTYFTYYLATIIMFTTAAFNKLPMGFQYPVQQPPPTIYQSQYGGFNPPIPLSFPQVSLSRGQSLPPASRQLPLSNGQFIQKSSRRNGQYPPAGPTQPNERRPKHGSKNKKNSKQRNVPSNSATDQGLYSDKEKNNLKNSEDRSRSPSTLLNNLPKETNQEQPAQSVEKTNGNISQGDITVAGEGHQQNPDERKNRKSRSKKTKKHDSNDPYERNNAYFEQPPPFYSDLPPQLKVHQQPLYNSYNQVYDESTRRGDGSQQEVKRSTRLPPEAKKKFLPHEDDPKKAYPMVGYAQTPFTDVHPPFNPYQSYAARPNFYGPTPPFNVRQPWPNQAGPIIVEEQRIDRLRNHIHSLENELHKLQKKLSKAALNINHNETSTKDETISTHRRSKRENFGSPRQTPVIVELNNANNNHSREASSKKHRHRAESNNSEQQENNLVQQSDATSSNIPARSQSPTQPKTESNERPRSEVKQILEPEVKISAPAKSSLEETAARLAHAAAAHVNARLQIPPPPPVQHPFVPTPEQQRRGSTVRLPVNGSVSSSSDENQQQRSSSNLNYNQSNNNEITDGTGKKHNRSAEKILDAFERFYMKDGKSATNAVKVKYIPEETSTNCHRQRNTNNNNQCGSSSRSSQNSSSSSSSSSSSTWSSAHDSSTGNFNKKKVIIQ